MPGCKYSYQLVQLSTSTHAIQLVVMTNRRRARFICVPQVYHLCLVSPLMCSYDSFWRACCKSNKHIVISGDDKAMLSKLGGLSNAASHGTIVTIAACCRALQTFNIHTEMMAAFLSLKQHPASQTVLALPDHVMAPCAQPSTNPSGLQMAMPFPVTLPGIQPPPSGFNKHYGLSASHKKYLADRAPLSQQMEELRQWLTVSVVLSREGLSQGTVSWNNIKKSIYLFLGYCHEYKQVTQPTLQLFLFPDLLAHFVSYLIVTKKSPHYANNMLSHFAKVLQWWQTKPGGRHHSFVEGLRWLKNLRVQVVHMLVNVVSYAQ